MAIEVIPKKPQSPTFSSANFLFYLSLILLLIAVLVLSTVYLLKNKSSRLLEDVKTQIAEKETAVKKTQEAQVLLAQKRINDFLFLLDSRRSNSQFFNSFQTFTHPQVYFNKVDLKIEQGKISLSGIAENPTVLGQQILLFDKVEYIQGINLAEVSISKEGKIEFDLELTFLSEKFRY